jgi:hypothetical protein
MSYSYKSIIDGGADSDIIYYNASIVNNNSKDGVNQQFPPVRFSETRDGPIIRDASQYLFSIIRFAMNGPNKSLPLWIPQIQLSGSPYLNQSDPNLTTYYLTLSYQRRWSFATNAGVQQVATLTVSPSSTPMIFRPEVRNTGIAPIPVAPPGGFRKQDLTSRYYWVSTYSHFVELFNETVLTAANILWTTFNIQWANLPDIDVGVSPTPYPTLQSFLADHEVPFLKYNPTTQLFELYGDTRAFNISGPLSFPSSDEKGRELGTNQRVPAFPPPVPIVLGPAVPQSEPYLRLFFNANLYGLLTNFKSVYYGASLTSLLPQPLSAPVVVPTIPTVLPFVIDYTYEICFVNESFTNIENLNPQLQGNTAVPPPAYNPFFLIPTPSQNLYWKQVQDYDSINSLWSPISAIVFTSTMLPVKKEYTAVPNTINNDGNTNITQNSASSFEPVIMDFVIDQQIEKADGWRDFVLYEPTAEYRLASLTASHDEIRNIDIQAFWKHRTTGELYPIYMFNNSDITIKMMFRKVDYRS